MGACRQLFLIVIFLSMDTICLCMRLLWVAKRMGWLVAFVGVRDVPAATLVQAGACQPAERTLLSVGGWLAAFNQWAPILVRGAGPWIADDPCVPCAFLPLPAGRTMSCWWHVSAWAGQCPQSAILRMQLLRCTGDI